MPNKLKAYQIETSRVYRGNTTFDRLVVYITRDRLRVQYQVMDNLTLVFPETTMADFLVWAKEDVTDEHFGKKAA
jgi:hypothetical protein